MTAAGQGTTAITATVTNPDGSLVYASTPFTVEGGSSQPITALTIVPNSLSLGATGQPGQFTALGTSGSTGLQEDVTASPQLVWSSSIPTIATVSSPSNGAPTQTCPPNSSVCPNDAAGLVKGVSAGSTTITAEYTNQAATTTAPAVVVTATASVTVTSTPAAEPLLSITVLPSATTIVDLLGSAQYLAYGDFSTDPTEMDITNGFYHAGFPNAVCTELAAAADQADLSNPPNGQCSFSLTTWISTAQEAFPIDSAGAPGATGGLITAEGNGSVDLYAEATNPDGTLVYSPIAVFNCPLVYESTDPLTGAITPGSCNGGTIASGLLSTLTVYNEGLNTTNWVITAPSATGTPNVIHCGPGWAVEGNTGGSICTATYPTATIGTNGIILPTTITLTATPVTSAQYPTPAQFGGWSTTCDPPYGSFNPDPSSPTLTNTCTVTLGQSCILSGINGSTLSCSGPSNITVGAIFN